MPSESKGYGSRPVANGSFEETVANAAILRLHTAAIWAEVSWTLRCSIDVSKLTSRK